MTPTPTPTPPPHPGDAALGPTPDGHRYFRRSIPLAHSFDPQDASLDRAFERARAMLQSWGPQLGAGMRIEFAAASDADADADADADGGQAFALPSPSVGLEGQLVSRVAGLIPLRAPFRVITAEFASTDHAGYAYETLPGHPERGREAFYVTRAEGLVEFTVMAFSQPVVWYARLGGPVTRIIQNRYTNKYLLAMAVSPR
ncbi:conserved hypothetical protein [Catenulispora acidiphila DSM 44928]|uniref:DUF1990 domain-containing protein n=1 Tax=Catenulispora acidiphila (strain DSM 44928 / JCM 14897 / NBRC 102108 / NRRL B-24433 / ID139908) TaxID=479433 RepID=C7PZ31_CATAD|nr:DUF1990 domain-containing protein [Catenulispora acidiphila]ACU69587.1 conserved hypothetical protein [Catenulispora acidiphila DSM 44928]